MDFVEEFKRAAREQAELDIMRDLCRRVAEIRAPFKTGNISLWLTDDYREPRKIVLEVKGWDTFTFPLDFERPVNFDGIVSQMQEIWRESRVEPEEHIVLGLE